MWLALVYWTYTDATRRGSIRLLWGLVAVIFPYVGTLVYLIVRPPEYLDESRERELETAVLERELRASVLLCPNCRNLVERDYLICPPAPGTEEILYKLRKAAEHGVGDVPLLRHGPAQRQDDHR